MTALERLTRVGAATAAPAKNNNVFLVSELRQLALNGIQRNVDRTFYAAGGKFPGATHIYQESTLFDDSCKPVIVCFSE